MPLSWVLVKVDSSVQGRRSDEKGERRGEERSVSNCIPSQHFSHQVEEDEEDQGCPALSAITPPRTEPVSGWTTREPRSAAARPTSWTPPAPATDHRSPRTAPTQLPTMETPELGGHLTETAQLTSPPGRGTTELPPFI